MNEDRVDASLASSHPLTPTLPYNVWHTSSPPPSPYCTNNTEQQNILMRYVILLLNTLIIIQSLQEKRLCSQFLMLCIFLMIINVPAATRLDPPVTSF